MYGLSSEKLGDFRCRSSKYRTGAWGDHVRAKHNDRSLPQSISQLIFLLASAPLIYIYILLMTRAQGHIFNLILGSEGAVVFDGPGGGEQVVEE